MGWEILWPLVLGFALSGIVQAVVTKGEMSRLLPDSSARTILIATGLGAASSSCSYVAIALARSLFRKGADFIAAMAFEFASTDLVLELGVILWVLMGWQFTLAEFIGGPVMIVLLVLLLRRAMTPALLAQARAQAERGIAGRMEGHAAMDMSLSGGSILSRALSQRGFTAISHFYVMDWASIWTEIVGGLLIAGALAAWVLHAFWTGLFLSHDPVWSKVVGPMIGPIVAVISFVCSVGNVPLAAVLWSGGISFGGVVAFLFADLIVLPILNIYRKYYGLRMTMLLFVLFYAAVCQLNLLVKIVIFNNGSLAFVELEMIAAGLLDHGSRLNNPNFASIAEATGIKGIRIEDPAEIEPGLRAAFGHKGPAIVDVIVNRQELSLPPKITLNQAVGFNLYAMRAILNGRGDEIIDLAKTNLFR
jgi:uncharacterized protein